jgi:hypothetical protein
MSEPEIARRCPSCGASIRERAFFCPQCGNTLEPKGGDVGIEVNPEISRVPEKQTTENRSAVTISESATEEFAIGSTERPDDNVTAPLREQNQTTNIQLPSRRDLVQKGDNLRKISTVVLDQASYDPSLRFILVAAVLFLFFLAILLLSKLIG